MFLGGSKAMHFPASTLASLQGIGCVLGQSHQFQAQSPLP